VIRCYVVFILIHQLVIGFDVVFILIHQLVIGFDVVFLYLYIN